MYIILRVTAQYPLPGPMFKREPVRLPCGQLLSFENEREASDYAAAMVKAAREENILDVSYRARKAEGAE